VSAPSSSPGLYSSPEIYDVAFGWDLRRELDFIERVFRAHGGGTVKRVLEPCCGTGRLLDALADRGYRVAGYDRSPEMVAFAAARLRAHGGEAWRGEMSDFRPPSPPAPFDAAVNLVNSIGYLLDDAALRGHLERTAEALRRGGIYLVQLSYGGEPADLARFGPWGNRRNDLSTSLVWEVVREDAAARRSFQRCRITARKRSERRVIEEDHVLRYWTHEDVDRVVEESPFRLTAIYWDRFEEFPLEEYRMGEYGNLYHILKRR
jgi:SAM-dependent methyltransferase